MRFLSRLTFLLVLFVASAYKVYAQDEYKYIVQGTVINGQKRPVAEAEVYLLPPNPCGEDWECIIEAYKTDSEGRFYIEETATSNTLERTLFVTTKPPSNSSLLISPPFPKRLIHTNTAFSGLPVHIKKNESIDLGSVQIQIYYGLVLLQLPEEFDNSFFKDEACPPDIWMRVHDMRGDVVSEGYVPCTSLYGQERYIAVALPIGQWQMDILVNGEIMMGSLEYPLTVKVATDLLRVKLQLSSYQNHPQQLQSIPSYDPAVARQKLEEMGFEYSDEEFIKRAESGNARAIELFLAAGINPDTRGKYGETALMAVAGLGYSDIVELLLAKGANVNAKDNNGATALMRAAGGFDSRSVKLLLSASAELNAKTSDDMTALIMATANDHIENVKLLLAAGADANVKDAKGKTALVWASELGHTEIAKLLKKAEAKKSTTAP